MQLINNYEDVLTYRGIPLTDENVLKIYNSGGMSELETYIFLWCRENEIPVPILSDRSLIDSLSKIKNSESINSIAGLDATHHFMGKKFLSCRGANSEASILDAWNDGTRLRKAIRTRIGGLISSDTTGADAINCVFTITPQMIVQGIRSSRQGFYASNFKPALARHIMQKYSTDNSVLDFSCGWGARILGAISLNFNYYGIDPCTADECSNIARFYSSKREGFKSIYGGIAVIEKGYSENPEYYKKFPKVSLAFSCPPYYDYEVYNKGGQDYVSVSSTVEQWISEYWKPTVYNVMNKLNDGGKFIFVISNELKEPMMDGLNVIEEIPLTSPVSHLSKKSKTGKTTKQNEVIVVCNKS